MRRRAWHDGIGFLFFITLFHFGLMYEFGMLPVRRRARLCYSILEEYSVY